MVEGETVTTLLSAVEALDQRKLAASDDGQSVDPARLALIAVGFGLDPTEMQVISRAAAEAYEEQMRDPRRTIRTAWLDGLFAGLLLAEMREREAA
jgi:hypothetical protein